MRTTTTMPTVGSEPGAGPGVDRMPAHWLMASLGKRVLRPGGVSTTRWLLQASAIHDRDDVLEIAPGLGATAREILRRRPRSYVGVERDAAAASEAERAIRRTGCPNVRLLRGDASRIPLPDGSATLVIGEAMLSMQAAERRRTIIAEAHRLLRAGGRYAIHELAVTSEELGPEQIGRIRADLTRAIHVGVRIGTVAEWRRWIEELGFEVTATKTAAMRLLEPERLIRDEGILGALRFASNALRTPGAVSRLREVRAAFRAHAAHLCAVAIVARRPATDGSAS